MPTRSARQDTERCPCSSISLPGESGPAGTSQTLPVISVAVKDDKFYDIKR